MFFFKKKESVKSSSEMTLQSVLAEKRKREEERKKLIQEKKLADTANNMAKAMIKEGLTKAHHDQMRNDIINSQLETLELLAEIQGNPFDREFRI